MTLVEANFSKGNCAGAISSLCTYGNRVASYSQLLVSVSVTSAGGAGAKSCERLNKEARTLNVAGARLARHARFPSHSRLVWKGKWKSQDIKQDLLKLVIRSRYAEEPGNLRMKVLKEQRPWAGASGRDP